MSNTAAPASSPTGTGSARVGVLCRSEIGLEASLGFLLDLGVQAAVIDSTSFDGAYIERLDKLRDLDYAVVVLAAEDMEGGGLRRDLLLQVGFLLGAIGRNRMCCLIAADVPMPAELNGAVRQPMDESGLWRLLLAREMRRAGLEIDMNKAI